jgi:hypothetical protein
MCQPVASDIYSGEEKYIRLAEEKTPGGYE